MEEVDLTLVENSPSQPGESPMIFVKMDAEAAKYVSAMEHKIMELNVLVSRYQAVLTSAWDGYTYQQTDEFLAWLAEKNPSPPSEGQMSLEEVET